MRFVNEGIWKQVSSERLKGPPGDIAPVMLRFEKIAVAEQEGLCEVTARPIWTVSFMLISTDDGSCA